MKAYPDAKVTTKNGTASLSGCPLCEGPQDMVHLCLHLHLPDWLGSNIVRSIWPIWRTPSHSSPVLLLEKHPTAKWLVEQVLNKNKDCKKYEQKENMLSQDWQKATMCSWHGWRPGLSTPPRLQHLFQGWVKLKKELRMVTSMNNELEVTAVFHNRGHRGGTRGVRKTVQWLGGWGCTRNYSICFGKNVFKSRWREQFQLIASWSTLPKRFVEQIGATILQTVLLINERLVE